MALSKIDDANGNMLIDSNKDIDYEWDYNNMLRSATRTPFFDYSTYTRTATATCSPPSPIPSPTTETHNRSTHYFCFPTNFTIFAGNQLCII